MATSSLDSTWLRVGKRRQFFFDDLLLELTQDVTRRFHQPRKVSEEPLIQADQPWEHVIYFTCSSWNVIHDPQDGLFKCWYEDWMIDDPGKTHTWTNPFSGKLCLDVHGSWPSRICYAQSIDGMHWEKPGLGIVKEQGRDTNIVLGGDMIEAAHCAYVWIEHNEPEAGRRFKAVFENQRMSGADAAGEGLFRLATSPDGIHWQIAGEPLTFGECGTLLGDVITISRDPETGEYWANNRHAAMLSTTVLDVNKPSMSSWVSPIPHHRVAQENRRRIYRSQSIDLHYWSTPRPLVVPDAEWDNLDDSFYGMEQFQIGDDWLGLLNVFHMTDNTMDVQLAYSRDGRQFQRIRPGYPFLARSDVDPDRWDTTMVTISTKPIVVGDELYVYHGGARNHHDWWLVGACEGLDVPEARDLSGVGYGLGLAKMVRDRFVSISSAEAREGLVVTPAIFPTGRYLHINACARSGGGVRVGLADGQDKVFDGFSREQCEPMVGDCVSHQVQWRNKTRIPDTQFMKLHFYLENADLFSFQFLDED